MSFGDLAEETFIQVLDVFDGLPRVELGRLVTVEEDGVSDDGLGSNRRQVFCRLQVVDQLQVIVLKVSKRLVVKGSMFRQNKISGFLSDTKAVKSSAHQSLNLSCIGSR